MQPAQRVQHFENQNLLFHKICPCCIELLYMFGIVNHYKNMNPPSLDLLMTVEIRFSPNRSHVQQEVINNFSRSPGCQAYYLQRSREYQWLLAFTSRIRLSLQSLKSRQINILAILKKILKRTNFHTFCRVFECARRWELQRHSNSIEPLV